MKGLLIKDFELIWHNKRMFLILLVVMLLAFQNYTDYSFLIGYTTMIFILLVFNTMSLDEYYKSMSFMMTLPIKRETYIVEKYIFMLGFSLLGAVLTTIVCICLHREMAVQLLLEAVIIYLVMALFQLLMLPVQLKFGGEKGRIVLIGILGVVAFISASLIKEMPQIFGMEGELGELLRSAFAWFLSLQRTGMVFLILLIFAVCGAVSYFVSRRVMLTKEF